MLGVSYWSNTTETKYSQSLSPVRNSCSIVGSTPKKTNYSMAAALNPFSEPIHNSYSPLRTNTTTAVLPRLLGVSSVVH